MKQFYVLAGLFSLCSLSVNAEDVCENDVTVELADTITLPGAATQSNASTKFSLVDQKPKDEKSEKDKKFGKDGSIEFNYLFVDDWGLEVNVDGHGVFLGFGASGMKEGTFKAHAIRFALGFQDRIMLGGDFFIEGRVAAGVAFGKSEYQYEEASVDSKGKVKYNKKTAKDSNTAGYLNISPKIGWAVSESLAITAGYDWYFNKFKFSKENVGDGFMLGLKLAF